LVQLREKDLPAGALYELALRLRRTLDDRARIVVNDRLDVALATRLDGVHLPEAGLPVATAVALGGDCLVGRSVHDPAEATRAIRRAMTEAREREEVRRRQEGGA